MPVHPQMQAVLDRVHSPEAPRFWELTPEQARLAAPVGVTDTERYPLKAVYDRDIDGSAGRLRLRIYEPLHDPVGALLFLHGGGFVLGNLDSHDAVCRTIASLAGCAVVAVDYRLAPEHPYPAALTDVRTAYDWLVVNSTSLGVATNAIAVGGDSAGGNLAAVLCLDIRDDGGPAPAAQLLLYPWVDLRLTDPCIDRFADGYFITKPMLYWLRRHYLGNAGDPTDPRVSPLLAKSHAHLPPALIALTEYDIVRDAAAAYVDALKRDGTTVIIYDYPGLTHAFVQFAAAVDPVRQALEELADEFRTILIS